MIVVVGNGFSNNLTQYDDFVPGSLFAEPRTSSRSASTSTTFDIEWLTSGPRKGQAAEVRRAPDATARRRTPRRRSTTSGSTTRSSIGGTDVFLIGHGYAPVITVRDGNGDVAYTGPVIFLPEDQATFTSFGVVKAPDAPSRSRSASRACSSRRTLTDGRQPVLGLRRRPQPA